VIERDRERGKERDRVKGTEMGREQERWVER